jgi:hypothetical protein
VSRSVRSGSRRTGSTGPMPHNEHIWWPFSKGDGPKRKEKEIVWRGMAHVRGVLPRSSRRQTRATTRPPILSTLTYLYLLYPPVLLALTLTVVISQACLYLH